MHLNFSSVLRDGCDIHSFQATEVCCYKSCKYHDIDYLFILQKDILKCSSITSKSISYREISVHQPTWYSSTCVLLIYLQLIWKEHGFKGQWEEKIIFTVPPMSKTLCN